MASMAQVAAGSAQRLAPSCSSGRQAAATAAAAVRCPPRLHALRLAASSSWLPAAAAGGSSGSSGSSKRQLAAPPPRATAADAAGGSSEGGPAQPAPQPPQQRKAQKPRRELSLQQRWRAIKFTVLEAAEKLSEYPAIAALLAALAAANARLKPLYDLVAALERKRQEFLLFYNEFVADETKRAWGWSKRYPHELAVWFAVPPFAAYFALTVFWQMFTPVSFALTVAAPLYYAWVLFDRWWVSPIFLAFLVTTPMKWVPWADKCLLWPGII